MTTGRFLTLKDVPHALEIQKNLVSGLLSSKNCFKFLSLINFHSLRVDCMWAKDI